jgi:sugar lactone lactonase YvrE
LRTIPKSKVECVYTHRALLAESPVWSGEENYLYWVDIAGKTFNQFDPSSGENVAIKTEIRVSSFALQESGGFIAATEFGFQRYDYEINQLTPIINPERGKPNNRLNDGRCDRSGRFWAGSMVEKGAQIPDANLYCLDIDSSFKKKHSGITLSNGIAWSPDNKIMYLADTRYPAVWTFDFNMAEGDITNQQLFIEFGPNEGVPDGAAIDTDGCYWLAQPRVGKICRYTPGGAIDTVIELPVSKPTMCAFGGQDLKTLYITSNSFGFTDEDMNAQPLAGSLFALEVTAQGLSESKFAG